MRDKLIAALKASWVKKRPGRNSIHQSVSRSDPWTADAWAETVADELILAGELNAAEAPPPSKIKSVILTPMVEPPPVAQPPVRRRSRSAT